MVNKHQNILLLGALIKKAERRMFSFNPLNLIWLRPAEESNPTRFENE